jgi:AbrB family looped-hinge helix DNA binding protein
MEVEMTRISEKGQVVIPSSLRKQMKIKKSDQFLIFGEGNTIILKKIEKPAIRKTFDEVARPLRESAKRSKFSREDLSRLIEDVKK